MSRRRRLLLIALVLGATGIYTLWRAPHWSAHLIESSLSRYFNRPVTVARVAVRIRTGELEVLGLRVGGITPDAPPFLEVGSVRVRPSLAPLRGRQGGSRVQRRGNMPAAAKPEIRPEQRPPGAGDI